MHAQHDVYPGGKAGLDLKSFIRTVLAADIGDLSIDQRDLAVVAQVDAAGQHDFDGVVDGQRHSQVHTTLFHLLPQA